MKILETYLISHLQRTIFFLLCATLLLVIGLCVGLSQGTLRQNAAETLHWQSEAFAYKAMHSLMAEFQTFEEASPRLQTWIEHYQDAQIEQMGIIDTTGHWLAHTDQSLRNHSVPEAFFKELDESQSHSLFGADLFQSLTPLVDSHNQTVGALYIGISTVPLFQRIWHNLLKHFGLLLLLLLCFGGGFLLLTHKTFLALQTLIQSSTAISSGDFRSMEIPIQGVGDIRQLTQIFRHMAQMLHAISLQTKHAATLIKTASHSILASTDRLAGSLEEQSASIAQTSMNMDNVVLASQQISKSTDHVVQIAESTRNDAQQGRQVAKETLEKMEAIQQSHQTDARNIQELQLKSQEISKIMDVIVTIADQTKLIAFNASLEAAGAGKAGRRFSVVAQEIRSLADNVIGSTATIRRRIADMQASVQNLEHSFESSTHRIRQGAEHTTRTAEWLQAILNGTTQTTRVAQKISRSLLKQQLASEEISTALKEQLANTNEFAKAGATARDIAEQLETLTEQLENVISGIKV